MMWPCNIMSSSSSYLVCHSHSVYIFYIHHHKPAACIVILQSISQLMWESILHTMLCIIQTLEDGRFTAMLQKICSVIHDDTHYDKGALNMRTQRCFAIRSGMNGTFGTTVYTVDLTYSCRVIRCRTENLHRNSRWYCRYRNMLASHSLFFGMYAW